MALRVGASETRYLYTTTLSISPRLVDSHVSSDPTSLNCCLFVFAQDKQDRVPINIRDWLFVQLVFSGLTDFSSTIPTDELQQPNSDWMWGIDICFNLFYVDTELNKLKRRDNNQLDVVESFQVDARWRSFEQLEVLSCQHTAQRLERKCVFFQDCDDEHKTLDVEWIWGHLYSELSIFLALLLCMREMMGVRVSRTEIWMMMEFEWLSLSLSPWHTWKNLGIGGLVTRSLSPASLIGRSTAAKEVNELLKRHISTTDAFSVR